MEIERKFLLKETPPDLEKYPHSHIAQGYLCVNPVLRIRQDGDTFVFTYKSAGLLSREEYNLPLGEAAFRSLLPKIEGRLIEKTRYRIPLDGPGHRIAEVDIFEGFLHPLKTVEVEFTSEEEALSFEPPSWFGSDVTGDYHFKNSYLAHCATSPDVS